MKLLKVTLVAVAATVAISVNAANLPNPNGLNYYVGVQGGHENMKLDHGSSSKTFNISGTQNTVTNSADTPDFYFNLHGGALYPVTPIFSLGGQLGFSSYGDYEITSTYKQISLGSESNQGSTAKATIYSLNLQGIVHAQYDNFFAQAHAGEGYFSVNESGTTWLVHSDNTVTSVSGSGFHHFDPLAGIQLGYNWDNFEFFVDYTHVFGTDYKHHDGAARKKNAPTMDLFGAGASYIF